MTLKCRLMGSAKFTRTIEDFLCGNCSREVSGNGYTNHCPDCLWSRHVDKNPGDRLSSCGGLMKPVAYFKKDSKLSIIHTCVKCQETKNNKIAAEDNLEILFSLALTQPPSLKRR